jgi:serine/threonine-protein kinase HipA
MPETRLFEGKYFGVKRFDRERKTKIHMLSVAALLNADYRLPSLDYQGLLTACLKLTGNIEQVYNLYRMMVINFLIKNRDDHAKNFSFLFQDGNWKLSPAYDLLPSNGFNGFHTTTIAGQGDPKRSDIQNIAAGIGLSKSRSKEIYKMLEEKCHNFRIS